MSMSEQQLRQMLLKSLQSQHNREQTSTPNYAYNFGSMLGQSLPGGGNAPQQLTGDQEMMLQQFAQQQQLRQLQIQQQQQQAAAAAREQQQRDAIIAAEQRATQRTRENISQYTMQDGTIDWNARDHAHRANLIKEFEDAGFSEKAQEMQAELGDEILADAHSVQQLRLQGGGGAASQGDIEAFVVPDESNTSETNPYGRVDTLRDSGRVMEGHRLPGGGYRSLTGEVYPDAVSLDFLQEIDSGDDRSDIVKTFQGHYDELGKTDRNVVETAMEAYTTIEDNVQSLIEKHGALAAEGSQGLVGSINTFIAGAQGQIRGLIGSLAGQDSYDPDEVAAEAANRWNIAGAAWVAGLEDEGSYTTEDIQLARDIIQSVGVGLTKVTAMYLEPGSRLTDKDYDVAAIMTGTQSATLEGMMNTMYEMTRRMAGRFAHNGNLAGRQLDAALEDGGYTGEKDRDYIYSQTLGRHYADVDFLTELNAYYNQPSPITWLRAQRESVALPGQAAPPAVPGSRLGGNL